MPLVHFLETANIKYLVSLQFRHTKQTIFFANLGNYSKDRHFAANSYQNGKFCEIVEIWNKLKNGSFFFIKFLSKVILNWNNENAENDEVAFLAGRLS